MSRSSTDVRHNDQFKNRDIGDFNPIILDFADCAGWTEIPLLPHKFSKRANERPPSGDHRKTNSWLRSVSVSSKTSEMSVSLCGSSKISRMV